MLPLPLCSHCYCPACRCPLLGWIPHVQWVSMAVPSSSIQCISPLKEVFLVPHFACLTPCRAHPWPVTWSSSTMLMATATSTRILVGFHFRHGPFMFVGRGRLGYIWGLPLSAICWHLKSCYVRGTRYFVLVLHGYFKHFNMAYILLQGLQQSCFGQHVCLLSIISYALDEMVLDIYVGQIMITVGTYEVTISCPWL